MKIRPRPVTILIVALVLVGLASCAAQARDKALSASLVALNAARDGLVTYSKAREMAIVAAATSEDDGKAKLASFRGKIDELVVRLEGAYLAIAAAAVANDDRSLAAAAQAVVRVQEAWGKLHGGPP